jgi:hypothetical protein
MTWFVRETSTAFDQVRRQDKRLLDSWARASIQAREALENAGANLEPDATESAPEYLDRGPAHSPLACRLQAAATSLSAAHEVLNTHFTVGPTGIREDRSDWAHVIVSVPVTRALLSEIAWFGTRVASQVSELPLNSDSIRWDSGETQRQVSTACQRLGVMAVAIRRAQRDAPAPSNARELLHAIPLNAIQIRYVPHGDATVTELYDGSVISAERARHATRGLLRVASWSPAMSTTSLRLTASASTVTSHHCEILLRSLAAYAEVPDLAHLRPALLESADTAARARTAWLGAAHAWEQMTTDTRGRVSQAAVAASDLALWTGRLAYTDPEWSLARGPSTAIRPPGDLISEPSDIPRTVSVIHNASETLSRLASTDRAQIHVASSVGRLLVPTRSLSHKFDIPHPYTRAPDDRIAAILAAYDCARTASADLRTAVEPIAAEVGAPSHVLTEARAVNASTDPHGAITSHQPDGARAALVSAAAPGPIERMIKDLGVTDHSLLQRGRRIDRAAEHVMLDAAESVELRRGMEPGDLNMTIESAELINYVHGHRTCKATAAQPRRIGRRYESAELEP